MPAPIAWTGLPVTEGLGATGDGNDLNLWSFLSQFWYAMEERAWASGSEFWPRTSNPYDTEAASSYSKESPGYTGTISGAVASGGHYVFTDSGKAWSPDPDRWYGNPTNPDEPLYYDIVIEAVPDVPWGFVRTQIIASTANTLTTHPFDIDDWCVGTGLATDGEDLGGKRYIIYKHHESTHESLHSYERWLEWPNATEHDSGTIASATIRSVTITLPRWREGQTGRDLMCYSGGALKRIRITRTVWNADHSGTLEFAEQPFTPDTSAYVVIDAGGKWLPGRDKPAPWWWYRGVDRAMSGMLDDPRYYTHERVSIGTRGEAGHGSTSPMFQAPVAAVTVVLDKPNSDNTDCVDTTVDALHIDLWSRNTSDEDCDVLDRPYSPDFYKSLSALQAELEGISPNFVNKRVTWHGSNVAPQNYTTGTWFKGFAANGYAATLYYVVTISTAVASGNGYVTFPAITLPANVIGSEVLPMAGCNYTIYDSDNKPVQYGYSYAATTLGAVYPSHTGTLTSTTRLDLRGATFDEANPTPIYPRDQTELDGYVGKTLVIAFGWDRFFERQARYLFAKTVFVNPDGGDPIDAAPGSYITRAASTHYAESSVNGTTVDTDTPAFVDGDLVRIIGDAWHHPTTDDNVTNGQSPDTPDRDLYYTTARARPYGSVTSGDSWFLRDDTRSLDGNTPSKALWPDGLARTDTFTASGGGTTTVANSTGTAAFWDGTTGRQLDFIVEVEDSGTWHRRPVTAYNAGTKTLTVAPAFPFATSGKSCRIREPRVLNDWKGRKLLFWMNGVRYEPVVTHNDDDTFYFADIGKPVPPVTFYTIQERQPGEVLRWDAGEGEFVKPDGGDDDGRTELLHADPRRNCPTIVRRFGRFNKGDIITAALFNQLYGGINELTVTQETGFWRNYETDPVSPGYNMRFIDGAFDADRGDAMDAADAQFTTGDYPDPGVEHTDVNDSTQLPHALKYIQEGSNFANINTADSWAVLLTYAQTTRMQRQSSAYAYTSADAYDVTEGDLPRPTNVGSPAVYVYTDDPSSGGHLYFDAQGSDAVYRKWSLLATRAAGDEAFVAVKVGDYTALPPDWPAETAPTVDQPNPNDFAGWSVASQNGTGSSDPVIVHDYGIPDGMRYRES